MPIAKNHIHLPIVPRPNISQTLIHADRLPHKNPIPFKTIRNRHHLARRDHFRFRNWIIRILFRHIMPLQPKFIRLIFRTGPAELIVVVSEIRKLRESAVQHSHAPFRRRTTPNAFAMKAGRRLRNPKTFARQLPHPKSIRIRAGRRIRLLIVHRKSIELRNKHLQPAAKLPQIIFTHRGLRARLRLRNARVQQSRQQSHDRDHHHQFDQRECLRLIRAPAHGVLDNATAQNARLMPRMPGGGGLYPRSPRTVNPLYLIPPSGNA